MKTKSIDVGDRAPEFDLRDQHDSKVALGDLCRRGAVVVFFYPRDHTPACTREACEFRDEFDEFLAAGAQVVGVSSDSCASHHDFAVKNSLPFPLLSDPDGQVRKAFGVPKTLGLADGRVTYVIDRRGFVCFVFRSQFAVRQHVDAALALVRDLAAPASSEQPLGA